MKILVVEENIGLSEQIMSSLRSENYTCNVVMNYEHALEQISLNLYSVIILNSSFFRSDDDGLIREVKSNNPKIGIIILSSNNSIEEEIAALEAGADDYLMLPVTMPELKARIKSIIRRCGFDGNNEIVFDDLIFRMDSMSFEVNGRSLVLTKKEYWILNYLLAKKNMVVPKRDIAMHIREEEDGIFESFDFVYSHIRNIRKKVRDLGGKDHINSIYGIGYMLADH